MKFSLEQDYPTGLAQLWSALGRPGYPKKKYRSLGSSALRMLKFEATDEMIEVELERSTPVERDKMPSWARNVVGSTQTMHHHTRWRRVSPTQVHAELDIAPVGMPVRARGVGSIVELSPRKTRMTLTFHVRCRVPFLGPGVTRLFADQVKEALRADHTFTLDYLAASATSGHDRSR